MPQERAFGVSSPMSMPSEGETERSVQTISRVHRCLGRFHAQSTLGADLPLIGAIRHMGTAAPMHTTAWLLDRIREGDTDARRTLIERVQPLLLRFAHGRVPRQLRPQEDTADLVQITWLKVLNRLELIDSREPGAFLPICVQC